MEIQYYLEETEVQKASFKQFSSRCHKWINILNAYKETFDNWDNTLKLVYIPVLNEVHAFYEADNALLDLVCEGLSNRTAKEGIRKIERRTVAA